MHKYIPNDRPSLWEVPSSVQTSPLQTDVQTVRPSLYTTHPTSCLSSQLSKVPSASKISMIDSILIWITDFLRQRQLQLASTSHNAVLAMTLPSGCILLDPVNWDWTVLTLSITTHGHGCCLQVNVQTCIFLALRVICTLRCSALPNSLVYKQ